MTDTTSAPSALAWSADNCTIGRVLDEIGDRWSLIVLREVFQGIRRFDDMTVRTSIPRQVLSGRLARLVEHGILRLEPYQEPGQRPRNEYRLTTKGLDLYPVLVAFQQWGTTYLVGPEGAPITFTHRDCGAEVALDLRCTEGHLIAEPRDVVPRPGPGARRRETS